MTLIMTPPEQQVKHLYKHGLAFEPLLAKNLEGLHRRVLEKKASLIIIDGAVGLGKTTMMTHVLDYFNKLDGKPEIQLDGAQLAMGGVSFLKKLRECYDQDLHCIGYDEAGDFSRRGSLTSFNAMLNRTFETFRAFRCVVVLALPNFNVLDNQLFDNQIPRMLIHLTGRNMSYGDFAVYDLMNMNWLRYWMKKSAIKDYAWSRVYPNFRGHFLDLPTARSKILDDVSISNKLKILRKSEIKAEGLVTYEELATPLNRSINWVMIALKNLKIKPKRTIDRKKYFEKDVMNILAEHLENSAPQGRPRTRF